MVVKRELTYFFHASPVFFNDIYQHYCEERKENDEGNDGKYFDAINGFHVVFYKL
jgi:hypothetical protein